MTAASWASAPAIASAARSASAWTMTGVAHRFRAPTASKRVLLLAAPTATALAETCGKKALRKARDGEFTTACAQTCPAGAITFGNLMDPASAVSRQAASPRAYRALESIGTRPAVYYLKKVQSLESKVQSSANPDSRPETRDSKLEEGRHE